MNEDSSQSEASLPICQLLEIDKICRQFEAAYKSNQTPTVDGFLADTVEPQRSELRRELLAIQAELERAPSAIAAVAKENQLVRAEPSLEEFICRLTESGLMTEEEVRKFLDGLPLEQHPAAADQLAGLMFQKGQLTRFQAQMLYQGRTRGLVVGNYVILAPLGEGGMGQVYKAQHKRMDRIVALKMLPAAAMRSPEAIQRFQREAKAAAKLSHPNIVTAYDADEADGIHFLVMEYVAGQDLALFVKQHGPLAVATAVHYAIQAARALDYAHGLGIVHRDLKPANLLLDQQGNVKVLDMGLARIEHAGGAGDNGLTHSGQMVGTLDYMAPEQAVDTPHADARADIYSLGCTLYYLLAGRPPYDGNTFLKKVLAHREQPVPSLRTVRSDVPESLHAVFQNMLAKKPEERQQSMAEVISALRGCNLPQDVAISPLPVQPAEENLGTLGLADLRSETSLEHRVGPLLDRPFVRAAAPAQPGNSASKILVSRLTRRRKAIVAAALVVGFVLVIWGIVLKMQTREGTLVVEINDPDVSVQVLSEEGKVQIERKSEKGSLTIGLDPGKHRLRLEKNGVEVFARDFTLASGGTEVIRARLEEGATALGTAEPKSKGFGYGPDAPPPAIAPFDEKKAKEHQAAWAKYLGVPVEMTNSIGMKFVLIPPGEFDMGTTDADLRQVRRDIAMTLKTLGQARLWQSLQDTLVGETPQHRVAITRPFYLGIYEVTRRQFTAMTGDTHRNSGVVGGNDVAIRDVSWPQAQDFCGIVSDLPAEMAKGFIYRLPTEAEWEYACRAGSTTRYSFGDSEIGVDKNAWHWQNSDRIHAVGEKNPNPWKLYDMHGNLWEWCADWFDLAYYKHSPRNDPAGPSTGVTRVVRGGSFADSQLNIRSATRAGFDPTFPIFTQMTLGFRAAINIPSPPVDKSISTSAPTHAMAPFDDRKAKEEEARKRAEEAKAIEGVALGAEIRAFRGHKNPVLSVAFSPDGKRVLTGAGAVYWDPAPVDALLLWNAGSGEQIRVFKERKQNVNSVAFSPDGKRAITASPDHTAILWDATTGAEIRVFTGHKNWVTSVAFSPNGKQVLTGSWDYTAILWDTTTGMQIRVFTGHQGPVVSVAFSPDGQRALTGSWDHTAILWDAATGKQIRVFKAHGDKASVPCVVAFSPDGRRVLTGTEDTAILWNADSGEQIRVFRGHKGSVNSVAFSPDGKRILTGSDDHTAILWDAATGRQIRLFQGHDDAIVSVAFSPDGRRVLTGSWDGTAILWDARGSANEGQ